MSIGFTILVKTSSTKSVILFYMNVAPKEFIEWLNTEIKTKNL